MTKNTPPSPRGFPTFEIIRDVFHVGGNFYISRYISLILDHYAVVFGGQWRDNFINWEFYNDVFLLNLKTWEWETLECGGDVPSPRVGSL